MSCRDIMNKNPLVLTPQVTVDGALTKMRGAHARTVAVVDEENVVVGLFSLRHLIENVLPVSMVSDSGMPNVTFSNAPGLDMRLQKILMEPLSVVMDRGFPSVYADTPAAEAARLIVKNGDCVIVVDEDTDKLLGLISDQDLVEGLLDNFTPVNKLEME